MYTLLMCLWMLIMYLSVGFLVGVLRVLAGRYLEISTTQEDAMLWVVAWPVVSLLVVLGIILCLPAYFLTKLFNLPRDTSPH